MIVVTVFHSISNQMDFHLVQNRKESCHHDHIPFNVKGNGNIVFSVWGQSSSHSHLEIFFESYASITEAIWNNCARHKNFSRNYSDESDLERRFLFFCLETTRHILGIFLWITLAKLRDFDQSSVYMVYTCICFFIYKYL